MKRSDLLLASFAVLLGSLAQGQDVRIGVLGLFHPTQLAVSSTAGDAVIVYLDHKELVLDSTSTTKVAVHAHGDLLLLTYGAGAASGRKVSFASREGGPVEFVLAIPGKIARRYRGRLEITNDSGNLVPVVTMDLETAVASVVAAETIPGEPVEALKAQAVAARSYFVAGKGRHVSFDFCDTTHCQFLRSPPPVRSAAFQAAQATRGLVLAFESHVFAAMYTRSCSGRTHTPAEVGLPPGAYPYYAVECAYCRRHPARWHSRIAAKDAAGLIASNEPSRLQVARKVGWSAIPSSDFKMRQEAGQVVIDGVGQGHGVGLCQAGSKAMAERGASFREILAHYYPNAILVEVRPGASAR